VAPKTKCRSERPGNECHSARVTIPGRLASSLGHGGPAYRGVSPPGQLWLLNTKEGAHHGHVL